MSALAMRWLFEGWLFGPDERGGAGRDGRHARVADEGVATPNETLPAADFEVVQRVRSGDQQAFSAMMQAHYVGVSRYVAKLTGGIAMAEEIAQDVFLHVWEHRATWSVRYSVRSYLYAMARNRALDVARRAGREAQVGADVGTGALPPGMGSAEPSALDRVLIDELWSAVRAAIGAMPEGRRTVFTLRWDHGMSIAEIAAVTGSSATAVERQLNRALHTLRKALARRP